MSLPWSRRGIYLRFCAARTNEPEQADLDTPEGISVFVQKVNTNNERILKTGIKDVLTTVTYARPISFSELDKLVSDYNVSIVQIELRGMTPDGERVTVASRTDKGFEETERFLFAMASSDGYELIGVTGMYAQVDSQMLSALQSDDLTYLADTSADGVFMGRRDVSGAKRNNLSQVKLGKLFPASVYWDLEETGIVDMSGYAVMSRIPDSVY